MVTESVVNSKTITNWMSESATAVTAQCDYLTQLDGAIGDGDHGLNMRRGFDSVTKALAGQDDSLPPGRLLIVAGKTLVSTVGGASGPLWGTALRRAGRSLGDSEEFDGRGSRSPRSTPHSMAWSTSEPPPRATRRWSTRSAPRSTG